MQRLIYLLIFFSIGCSPKPEPIPPVPLVAPKIITDFPKNIILVVVEGMGLAHLTAGIYRHDRPLSIEKFPVTGIHQPSLGNNIVSDSLTSMVALSCGIRLNTIAETDTIKHHSIIMQAKKAGKAVGIVTDMTMDSALPSAFIAYEHSDKYKNIMAAFFSENFDLFIGKWHPHFKKYKVFQNYQFLNFNQNVNVEPTKNLIGLIDDKTQNQQQTIKVGLKHLQQKSEAGFFLVVENNKVEQAAMKNDAKAITEAIIEFDKTIATIVDFAEADQETLVIVTSNQEIGGFALNPGTSKDTIYAGFTSQSATGIFIPTFAYGPGAHLFEGMYSTTAIFAKMQIALN